MRHAKTGIAAALVLATTLPAMAHHSFAMFANDKTITVAGTVQEFEWINPHSWIHLTVMGPTGKPEQWAFEMGGPGQLASRGWTKTSLKVGDKITMTAHPLWDGSHGGSFISLTMTNGTELSDGRPGG